jgi:hypothetical protein
MVKKLIVYCSALFFVASPALILKKHRSESVETAEIRLSVPYIRAVSALSKKENLESFVSSGGARLVSREWDEFKFDLKRVPKISTWELKGTGRFVVRGSSKDFKGEATMLQRVEINKEGINISGSMQERSGFVVEYRTDLGISNQKTPILKARNELVYERIIPFWMCSEMDRMVSEYNRSRLDSLISVMVSAMEN